MTTRQLREYCEAEFENIEIVIRELFTVVKPRKRKYSTVDLAATATFLHNFYNGIENVYNALSNYLSFRHFFVHAYSFTLRWEDLKPLVDKIEDTLKTLNHVSTPLLGNRIKRDRPLGQSAYP